ncbi:S1C family serine protease [Pseudoroseomonas cervicalis]|uniref:S1C family serine protease n=1 Tax=Teichococcus cervicalis TaxID=204525 RepID=UPI0022F199CA|nr:serine protease [Pseudoroseomonas cervicalis]WBV44388.1 serine protease [Pseudoroseomonas cervicalis]
MRPASAALLALLATLPAAAVVVAPPAMAQPAGWESTQVDPRAMPVRSRILLQDALIWSGHYNGLLDGGWGPASEEAMNRWRATRGLQPAASYPARDLLALFVQGARLREQWGWREARDPATGAVYGYPSAFVTPRPAADGSGLDFDGTLSGFGMSIRKFGDMPGGIGAVFDRVARESGAAPSYRLDRPDRQAMIVEGPRGSAYFRFEKVDGAWVGISVSLRNPGEQHRRIQSVVASIFSPTGRPPVPAGEATVVDVVASVANRMRRPGPAPAAPPDSPPQAAAPAPQAPPGPSRPQAGAAPRQQARTSSGTGFVVRRNGMLVTNAHVVKGCSSLALPTGEPVVVRAADERRDLALLQVNKSFPAELRFRRDQTIDHGERVRAFGYPFYDLVSRSLNITEGIVTALAGLRDNPMQFQVNAAIQPGNSGGPVVDDSGLVIGVAVSTLTTTAFSQVTGAVPQSLNYAIRGQVVESFLLENGVETERAPPGPVTDLRQIAREVSPLVMPVICTKS